MDNISTTYPIIGKDVIESLTIGMYEDCRFIYREYIQNSADQIDKAIESGLLKKGEGGIYISINPVKKQIIVEDDATGISKDLVLPILKNIAMSTKERGKDKGFRGIGRLGGLGYCSKLTFETSFAGEPVKSVMEWDAALLKTIINDRSNKDSATEVLQKVTTFSTDKEDANKHYFKVILDDVSNENLLDDDHITKYLKMVAPIEYPNAFIFRNEIKKYSEQLSSPIDEYKIYLDGELLSKSYTTRIYVKTEQLKKIDEIFELRFFRHNATDGQLLYWGWYGISTFEKSIEKCNDARGIRLRKANIQIGSEDTLVGLFKEQRGNFYFFGEIHAVHPDLIPNSRRDNFCENEVYAEYEFAIKQLFHSELHKLYYDASKIRNANKEVITFVDYQESVKQKELSGFTNHEDKDKSYKELEAKKKKAEEAKRILENYKAKSTEDSPIAKIYNRVVSTTNIEPSNIDVEPKNEKPKFIVDKYSGLDRKERKVLSRILAVIDNVLSKDMAQNLKDKIDEEFTK